MAGCRSFAAGRPFLALLLGVTIFAGCNAGPTGDETAPSVPPPQAPIAAPLPLSLPQPVSNAASTASPATAATGQNVPFDEKQVLSLFAQPVSGGWEFPSRYHYNEWRLATGRRRERPHSLKLEGGESAFLRVRRPAKPGLVILIDDLGNNAAALRTLGKLPYPVNGAMLPHSPLARQGGAEVRKTGGDVLLHLPLEPIGYPEDQPGPGALWVTMPVQAQTELFVADWNSVPGRVGLNNHMGSKFTADRAAMATLAALVAERQAVFVDSRTVPRSHALREMVVRGVPALGRTHFLDEVATEEAVRRALDEAIAYARSEGYALAIGHPNRATLKVLKDAPRRLQEAGVEAIPLHTLFLP